MVRRRLLAVVMVFLIVFSYSWTPISASGIDNTSSDYVGPGKHETIIYITAGSQKGESETKDSAGKVQMWNTREQFVINMETDSEWKISEYRIYVGADEIPISEGGAPKTGVFPFKKQFSSPVQSYKLELDLSDDLDFSWGQRNKGERIQNVAIYLRLIGAEENGKQNIHKEAWAYGEKKFESNRGWWMRYALDHPKTGHFVDAPVGGLRYNTSSHKGQTDDSGAFDYIEGEMVALSIGSLQLGTALAQHKISPLDLIGTDDFEDPRVVNMARLLQSLDADGDPKRGIEIIEPVVEGLNMVMSGLGITEVDFSDSQLIEDLIESTIAYSNDLEGVNLKLVSAEEARGNLEKGLSSTIFRKNISKTPDMETAKAKLELMPIYAPALRANGEEVELKYFDSEGNETSTRSVAKPLISVYADEVPDTDGAMDVFAAVSRDEGNTWKTTNLSRSAERSSFTLANGYEYPGTCKKPIAKVQGNKILVAWTSKYARSGKPTYSIRTDDDYLYDDEYYEEDVWGVGGPQRSFDYSELDFPEVGELPFSVVWVCRGTINPITGEITWFKPERLTSGRRDAFQVTVAAARNAGFGVTWQEDSEGLRPGEQAGPGEGWSGATTNHKTDIWYSYIQWNDFDVIDTNFISGGDPQHDEDKELTGRPKTLVPMSLPVRVSDNDTLNSDNMMLMVDENGPIKDENGKWVIDPNAVSGKSQKEAKTTTNTDSKKDSEKSESLGSHRYGLEMESGFIVDFYEKINNQGETKWIAITSDGRLMDGDTGASRPNLMLQPYQKPDGSFGAWAMLGYEETKGVGSGPPEDKIKIDLETITEYDTVFESVYGGGSGEDKESKGSDRYYPDRGKNVIYHSFDFTKPDLVSAGTILNPQAKDSEGNLLFLEDEEGNDLIDWDGRLIPAYENARRPRFIVQSKKNALGDGTEGTVMVSVFKMGEEGKGRPSDIFMRRWFVKNTDKGNPYDAKYLTEDIQNISSVTPTETWVNPDNQSEDKEPIKIIRWEQSEENLDDFSWTNPYDDARAHRGFMRGDFLAIAYIWTPNWAAARNGNDVFNLYIRRSFDGGATWTTDPNGSGVTHCEIFKTQDSKETHEREEVYTDYGPGEFEPARNVSQLRNTKESVIEPRLVGVPGSILIDGKPLYPEDKQNPNAFWVTYGTESYPGRHSEEEKEPLDLYYSYSTNQGETYFTITKTINPEGSSQYAGETVEVWDWLAKDNGQKVSAQAECQIRMTPDGSIFYAVWNETSDDESDVMFRRIMRDGGSIEVSTEAIDTVGPKITILGIGDGDIVNNANITILLNEEGTWTANLHKDTEHFAEFGPEDIPYTINSDSTPHSYRLMVNAEDSFGNTSSKEITFSITEGVPEINVNGVNDGEISKDDKTITVSATGDETSIVLTKDGGSVSFTSGDTIVEDGEYVLSVTSRNISSSLTAIETISFIIDKEKPNITVTGISDGESYTGTVTPVVLVSDNHSTEQNIELALSLNGSEFISGTSIKDNGSYILNIKAIDEAGNESTVSYAFTISKRNNGNSKDDKKSDNDVDEEPIVVQEEVSSSLDTEIVTKDKRLKVYIPSESTNEDITIKISHVKNRVQTDSSITLVDDMIYDVVAIDKNGNKITKLNKDLTLEFSYDEANLGDKINDENIRVFYLDDKSQRWVAIPTEINTSTKKITAHTDNLSIYAVMDISSFPKLTDVKGHWAEKHVYKVVSRKIASGDPSGMYRPEDMISREEFIKLVVLSVGLKPESEQELTFKDKDEISSWARGYVAAAVNAGILGGYEDNTFKPKRNISRSEIATIIMKSLNKELSGQPQLSFIDSHNIPAWAVPYVAMAVEEGIISGFPDGTFRSDNYATRAQAAAIISRILDL